MNMKKTRRSRRPSRRDVLRTGALAAAALPAAGCALPAVRSGFHSGGTDAIRVGLVGCGGRGTGAAANALQADPQARLVAMADVFPDQLESSLGTLAANAALAPQVDVPPERRFTGLSCHLGLLEHCDLAILATPPFFRPAHVRAAVEAGKHLFVEKPVAVDAPGVRSVRESCALARSKGLSVMSGLCYRHERAKRETFARLHGGAIGEIVAMQCTYDTSGVWHRGRQPHWSELEHQVRNWYYFTWLSGDHVVEQHIHSLDKLAWAMGDRWPVKCTASGGRSQRTDPKYGNIYDHFNAVFEWAGGVRGFSSCRQWNGASADVSDHVWGTRGVAHLQTHQIEGPERWRWRSEEPDDMYQSEMDALFAALRSGEPIDDGEVMCNSTLMAILERMSAYTGQAITWEMALSSVEDLTPRGYPEGDPEVAAVAVPGVTRFS